LKIRTLIISILISLLPAFLIFLSVADLIQVFEDPGAYPFGSAFVNIDSIYTSQTTYTVYAILFDVILLLLIYFSFKPRRWPYFFALFLAVLFFLYPIFTANA